MNGSICDDVTVGPFSGSKFSEKQISEIYIPDRLVFANKKDQVDYLRNKLKQIDREYSK